MQLYNFSFCQYLLLCRLYDVCHVCKTKNILTLAHFHMHRVSFVVQTADVKGAIIFSLFTLSEVKFESNIPTFLLLQGFVFL